MRVLASFALFFLLSANVSASPPSDEVKAQVRKATGEYNLGQYLEAAHDYEAAYLQTLDPNLLFNVAQAYRLGGDSEKAITAYRSYLRSGPRGEQRALAEAKLHELEERRATAPAAPLVPTAPVAAPEPAAKTPTPVPTPAFSTAAAPPPASSAAVEPSNVLVSSPAAEAPAASPFYKRWPFWVVTSVVVAGGVATAIVLANRGSSLDMSGATLGTKGF